MDASKPPPDAALANLLYALRYRGLAVGPDDAARVAAVFRHAEGWSKERRVRALTVLLGRSEEERQLIRQLTPFLFINAPDTTEKQEGQPAATQPAEPPTSRQETPPSSPPTQQPRPTPPSTRKVPRALLLVALLLCGAALAVFLPSKPAPVVSEPVVQPQSTPATTESPWRSVSSIRANEVTCDRLPALEWPGWVFAGSALLLLLPGLWFWRNRRLLRREQKQWQMLADSEGERLFRPVPPDHLLVPWMDTAALREAAFLLNAPSEPTEGRSMNVERSVEETARQAGRPVLVQHRWLQQRPLCFIEDISPAMASWPGLGAQIVAALERQGGEVHHWRMRGTPESLSPQEEPWSPLPLEQALAATPNCTLILLGNVAPLDLPGRRGDLSWLEFLGEAVWLHPGEQTLWNRGAQFLSTRVRMVPVSEGEMDRMVGGLAAESAETVGWQAPEGGERDGEGRVALLRVMLGEAPFCWLVAGSVLDTLHLLSLRTWRGMGGLPFIGVSKADAERALALPEVMLLDQGGVALAPYLRHALLREVRQQAPNLLSQMVGWVLAWLEKEVARQPEGSLAQVEARITLARLLALDPQRHPEARRLMTTLAREGVGRWLEVGVAPEERAAWPSLSLALGKKLSRAAKLTIACVSLFALSMGWLAVEWHWGGIRGKLLQADLQLLGPEPVRYLAPDAPLLFCDRRQLAEKIRVTYQETTVEVPGEKDANGATVWSLPWDSPLFAGKKDDHEKISLKIGYSDTSRDTLQEIILFSDVRKWLSALLHALLKTPDRVPELVFWKTMPLNPSPLGTPRLSISLLAKGVVLKEAILDQGNARDFTPDLLRQGDELRISAGNRLLATLVLVSNEMTQKTGKFVPVPGGTFEMGCGSWQSDCDTDEKPPQTVTVAPFEMGQYEVTQGQWKAVMGSNPSHFSSCGDNCPVEKVSWDDVQAFIQKLNALGQGTYRLPTEVEWEYACRSGGKPEKFCGGNDINGLAWYTGNSENKTHPVGQKIPNGLGIYDMSGNVWEWTCSDSGSYGDGKKNHAKCSTGGSLRVGRGGGWGSIPDSTRSALRNGNDPGDRYNNLGFRLARTSP